MQMGRFLICSVMIMGRLYGMYRQTTSIMKGIGVGMVVGAAAAMLAAKAAENNRALRHSAHRAAKAVTNLAGDMGQAVVDTVSSAAKM